MAQARGWLLQPRARAAPTSYYYLYYYRCYYRYYRYYRYYGYYRYYRYYRPVPPLRACSCFSRGSAARPACSRSSSSHS